MDTQDPEDSGHDRPRGRLRRTSGIAGGAALALASVAVGVLGAEAAARLVFTDFYRCDPLLGWAYRPGRTGHRLGRGFEYWTRVEINERGFRDVERTLAKPPGAYRIALLGDSMVAGVQVAREETLAARLEAALAAERPPGGARIEVWNLGVDGYGTAQQLLLLEERGTAVRPDLVLATVFPRNDVADNWPAAGAHNHGLAARCGRPFVEPGDVGREPRVVPPEPLAGAGWRLRLAVRSRLVAVLSPGRFGPPPAFFSRELYHVPWPPEVGGAMGRTQALLRALAREARAAGGVPAVVVLPDLFQATLRDDERRALAARGEDPERPYRRLLDALSRDDVPALDLRPVFWDLPRSEAREAYLPRDGHWSARGHARGAEAVLAWLRRECEGLRLPAAWCGVQKARGGRAR